MIKLLETERLIIVAPTLDHIELVNRLDADPDVMLYIGNGKSRPKLESDEWYKKSIEHYKKYGYSFGLVFEKTSKEFVGRAGINFNAYDDTQPDIEIGYRLHKKFWNNGYATELAQALIQFGFQNLKLKKLCGFTHPENYASRHVLKKVGMQQICNDKYADVDVIRYEIVSSD